MKKTNAFAQEEIKRLLKIEDSKPEPCSNEFGPIRWKLPDGKLHRRFGPAVACKTLKEWYINGLLHREDGPALEWISGKSDYYSEGKRHRIDGPAVIQTDGTHQYWINGFKLTKREFKARTRK